MATERATPEQALAKLQEACDAKQDYDEEGPATVMSLSIKAAPNFVSLPIEVTYVTTLLRLNLGDCVELESLPEGERDPIACDPS